MFLKRILHIIAFILFLSQISDAYRFKEPKCISPIDTRTLEIAHPERPSIAIHEYKRCVYTISRHHIIPYHIVREFFNKAFSQKEIHPKLIEFVEILLTDFIEHERVKWRGFDGLIGAAILNKKFRLPKTPLIWSDLEHSTELNFTLAAQTMFVWMPFNVFEGPHPQNRAGVPVENFEYGVAKIIGESNMNSMVKAFRDMTRYIDTFKLDVANGYFVKAIDNLIDVRNRNRFGYPRFNSANWKLVHAISTKFGSKQCTFHVQGNATAEVETVFPSIPFRKDIYCINTYEQMMQYIRDHS